MGLGVGTILDGELGTAVQTAQAHGTVLLYPDRLSSPQLNCLDGTFLGAQAAAHTGVLHRQVFGPAQGFVEGRIDQRHDIG